MPAVAESAIPLHFEKETIMPRPRSVLLWGREIPCSRVDGSVYMGQSLVVRNGLEQEGIHATTLVHGFIGTVISLREGFEDVIQVLPEHSPPKPVWIGKNDFLTRYSTPHVVGIPHRDAFFVNGRRVETLCFSALRGHVHDAHVVAARFEQPGREQIIVVGQQVAVNDQEKREKYEGLIEKLEVNRDGATVQVARIDAATRTNPRTDLFNIWV